MDDQARRTDTKMSVIPDGCHFCLVYKDKAEMANFLQDYFMSGLDNNELCVWMTSDLESTVKAKEILKNNGIYIDSYIRKSQLEILTIPELPENDMALLASLLIEHWKLMYEHAVLNGFDGLRFNVDLKDIEGICPELIRYYNDIVKDTVEELGMKSLCTCPIDLFTPSEVIELNNSNDKFIIKMDERNFSFNESTLNEKQAISESRRSRQKNEKLITIYERSPYIAFRWKAEEGFPVEFVSDNIIQFGYDPESLMSHEIVYADIIHPDDVEGYYSDLFTFLKEKKETFCREYHILDKNGNLHWIYEHSWFELDENGLSDYYQGIIREIFEKKAAEDELKKLNANYRALADSFDDAFYIQDPDGNILETNNAGLNLLGYAQEEILSLNFRSLLHPDHVEDFKTRISKIIDNGNLTFESALMRKEGSSIPVEIHAKPLKYAGKDSVLVAPVDITERRNKEENLSAAKASAETGTIAKCEFLANMTHELRTPLNAIIGFSDVLLEDSGVLDKRHVKYLHNISDSGKKLLGIINDILDISKIESGNVELHYEHFLVWESFDIIYSGLAQMAEKKNVEIRSDLDPQGIVINADKQKFEQVLRNLLDNAIKFTPAGGSVDLYGRFVNERLVVQVKDTGIGIPEENCSSLFDSFTQADGSYRRGYGGSGLGLAIVKHFVELHGGNVWIRSKPGIGSTFSFDIPIAVASPHSMKYSGREKVPENSEYINSNPDKDSDFDIICNNTPYNAPYNTAEEDNIQGNSIIDFDNNYVSITPEIIGPDNCKDDDPLILVVEDDDTSRELLMLAFIDGGYRVVPAGNGADALALARKLKPFAITLDIMLPEMNGWEILKQLKADTFTSPIPVVIVSMLDQKETALELGAADYLAKPFDREYLLKIMERFKRKPEGKNPKVLLVDDEPYAVDLLSSILETEGFTTLRSYTGMDAIDICTEAQPDLMILDLVMADLTGFDVISTLRAKPETSKIPIIVCTGKELTTRERLLLNGKVDLIMQKGAFSKKEFLDAVHLLSPDVVSK